MPRLPFSEKISGASKLASATEDGFLDVVLDIDMIHPAHENFYPIEGIEELADNMLDVGHIEPLIIADVSGVFKLVSGHRRYFAIKRNVECGHNEFKKVRCSVKKMSQPMYMLTLTSANAFNRKLDDATLLQQAQAMEAAVNELIASGELVIEGKKRDYMASFLGISNTKMAQINKINSSLVDEGKRALAAGEINFSKAYETSRLEPERQRLVIEDNSLLSSDVKSMVKDIHVHASISSDLPEVIEEEFEQLEQEQGAVIQATLSNHAPTPEYINFLLNYKSWGIWFEEPRLGTIYYQHVFEDGCRIVAVEYPSFSEDENEKEIRFHFMQSHEIFNCGACKAADYKLFNSAYEHVRQALLGKG